MTLHTELEQATMRVAAAGQNLAQKVTAYIDVEYDASAGERRSAYEDMKVALRSFNREDLARATIIGTERLYAAAVGESSVDLVREELGL